MGLINTIKNVVENRKQKEFERRILKMYDREHSFDPLKWIVSKELIDNEAEQKKLALNMAWVSGDPAIIRAFHRERLNGETDKTLFWKTAPNNIALYHSGLPKLIASKMPIILFGPGYAIDVKAYTKRTDGTLTNTIDRERTKRANEIVTQVLAGSGFDELIHKMAFSESWSGHVGVKLNYDFSLSPFPILQTVDRRFLEISEKWGRTQAITFKELYEVKNERTEKKSIFEFRETYTRNQSGYAIVISKLFRLTDNGVVERKPVEVPLTTLPETAEILPEFTYSKVKQILALEKPNLKPSGVFDNGVYGESDFIGATDSFNGVDEAFSNIYNEIRDNRNIRIWPVSMTDIDSDGKMFAPDSYTKNFIKSGYKVSESDDLPKTFEFTDKTDSLKKKFDIALINAAVDCGLSPLTLGFPGLESIASSDKSSRERAKTTLETRNAKLAIWRPFIDQLITRILEMTSELQTYAGYPWEDAIPKIADEIETNELDINVIFNDYVVTGVEERITTWGLAKTSKVASTDLAVTRIHGSDLDDASLADEINRIKFEEGMTGQDAALLDLTETTEEAEEVARREREEANKQLEEQE